MRCSTERTAADLVQQGEGSRRHSAQDQPQPAHMCTEGAQVLLQALSVAHIRQHLIGNTNSS